MAVIFLVLHVLCSIVIWTKTASYPGLCRRQDAAVLTIVGACLANPSALRMLYHHFIKTHSVSTAIVLPVISDWERCETGIFPSLVLSRLSLCPNHAHAFCLGSTQDPTAPHYSVFTQIPIKCIYFISLALDNIQVLLSDIISVGESVAQSNNINGLRRT